MNVLVVQTNQEIGVTAVVENADTGEMINPAAVQFYILEPDETIVVVPPGNPSVGVFVMTYELTKRGTYGIQVDTNDPEFSAGCNVTAGYANAWAP